MIQKIQNFKTSNYLSIKGTRGCARIVPKKNFNKQRVGSIVQKGSIAILCLLFVWPLFLNFCLGDPIFFSVSHINSSLLKSKHNHISLIVLLQDDFIVFTTVYMWDIFIGKEFCLYLGNELKMFYVHLEKSKILLKNVKFYNDIIFIQMFYVLIKISLFFLPFVHLMQENVKYIAPYIQSKKWKANLMRLKENCYV